jgi:gas vesicle protein
MNKLLLGLMLGIGIGILIAPDKGTATRKKLKEGFDDLLETAGDTLDDLVDQGRQAFNTAKDKVSENLG